MLEPCPLARAIILEQIPYVLLNIAVFSRIFFFIFVSVCLSANKRHVKQRLYWSLLIFIQVRNIIIIRNVLIESEKENLYESFVLKWVIFASRITGNFREHMMRLLLAKSEAKSLPQYFGKQTIFVIFYFALILF